MKKKYIKLTLILLMAAALIYAAIFFVVDQRAKSAEKKEFLANKAQIEEITKKITAAYPPSEEKHDESCSYQSAKFGRGDRYCEVAVRLSYGKQSLEYANIIAQGSISQIGYSLRPNQTRNDRRPMFIEPNDSEGNKKELFEQSLTADLNKISNDCGVFYYYDTGSKSEQILSVVISCVRVAKAEYFPVQKH